VHAHVVHQVAARKEAGRAVRAVERLEAPHPQACTCRCTRTCTCTCKHTTSQQNSWDISGSKAYKNGPN
jgi:hypothetical protein